MKKYTHYEVEVIYQQLTGKSFREVLTDAGIKYVDLPILEADVLKYSKDGMTKYALIDNGIAPDEYIENVYTTTEIPADMSWKNLLIDCRGQEDGENPMQLKTKAKVICDKAIEMAREAAYDPMDFFGMSNPDPEDFQQALITLGYNLDMIKEMNHYDVDDDFLNAMDK